MNKKPKNNIAVVVLNWNGKALLEKFLPALVAYSPEATLYVADNNSTDDSISFLKEKYPAITVIQNNANYGYAKGYNLALANVEEEFFALVNSDIEVTENWLQPVLALFEKEPETAIIQPKILAYNQPEYFEYAGAAGGFVDQLGFPFCRGRIFNSLEKDQHQYDDITTIFWASGACFFIRKSVFHALKGFDADFFAHQEEIDLCWRAFNQNYQTRFCGFATVYHVGGATLENSNPKKTYLNFRNSLWMLVKNLPLNKLFPLVFLRLFLDGLAAIRFLSQGQFAHFWAILKAHFSFYLGLPKIGKKRVKFAARKYYATRSIVYEYYGKKVRFYKDLK